MVIADSPSNPSGAVIPPDEYAKVLAVCQRKGVWLLADECYSHFTYGDAKPFSIASVPDSKNALIIVGSFSKTFAMTGWRLGYVLAPQPLIAAITKLQSQSTSNPTSIAQYAGWPPCAGRWMASPQCSPNMRGAASASSRACARFPASPARRRRARFTSSRIFRRTTMPKCRTTWPCRSFSSNANTSPWFPAKHSARPGIVRISYATSMDRIEEGLRRIGRFFGQAK